MTYFMKYRSWINKIFQCIAKTGLITNDIATAKESLENSKNQVEVRAMREAANMTQEELATICDVSWRTISNLERGTVVPDLFMIYRIAQNFDVKIDELLDHQIINQKSLSRIEKENIIIEKIKRIDDNVLDYIDEQLCLLLKHFNH